MWQFWIDVGGTFTDCLAQSPDGTERQAKVLSSGRFKGRIDFFEPANCLVDSGRQGDPDGFWDSACLSLLADDGQVLFSANVDRFDSGDGRFSLDQAVPDDIQSLASNYELDANQNAPLMAMRTLLGVPVNQSLPPSVVHLGTTRGTNALLTRSGARTGLVTSRGLRDFLTIGDQARPKLFELAIRKRQPLFETSLEIQERVLSDGTVECVPDVETVRQQLQELRSQGIDSVAVCLMFGFKYPAHEQLVGRIARDVGFSDVRLSHEVSPLIKLISRGETTVLDAYLNPVIARYLDEIEAGLADGSRLRLMTSAGGLVSRGRFSGKDSVLSGPAGGVVGAARIAAQFGFEQVIGFDMGGTSTDVSRFSSTDGDDSFEREYESYKAGVRIVTPMLAVETVAAGGGSVCWFDGTKLCVGPDSAGADPGPACYGRGGPLAITDINLFLGRIRTEQFPFKLDQNAVENRLQDLCRQLKQAGFEYSNVQLADGFLEIANHSMAAAISTVSVAKGYDPVDHVLLSFGGAGSQHCCAVAENLGMTQILDHPQSSILSAVGIRLADQTCHVSRAVDDCWDHGLTDRVEPVFKRLEDDAIQQLESEGYSPETMQIKRSLDLRYAGTDQFLTLNSPEDGDYGGLFTRLHQQRYGYLQDRSIEVVAARVEAVVIGNRLTKNSPPKVFEVKAASETQTMSVEGEYGSAGFFHRDQLQPGDQIMGPAIIADRFSTTIVDPHWSAQSIGNGTLLIERTMNQSQENSALRVPHSALEAPDPVQLEIFNSHFASIARQMGIVLQLTSVSVNVKERLDFSCAVFTSSGELVVNAPHIPVHLGAMGETVRCVIGDNLDVVPGDVFVTNDPYAGGSHLPDVTVVTPVFDPQGKELWFWVASRSHHAEIGGKAPGSMPADAKFLIEEGVLIDNFRLVDAGNERLAELEEILKSPPYPSRCVEENLADLAAQVAANQSGVRDLLKLVDQYSFETVHHYMDHIQSAAEQQARNAIGRLPNRSMTFSDKLDNGSRIQVAISKTEEGLEVDFSGTDPVTGDNLNANPAIVSSAVMYVVRCLVDSDIPLNEGLLKPVHIHIPDCLLNPARGDRHPENSPAIVGGNVETSQRVVDVLLGALGIAAASQGTMNNWLIGDESFGYYETVGGGSGATASCSGADAVHSHMTNTRLTDPEILETRYPCVLREFSIRVGSGGAGEQPGGSGMVREIEFTRPLTLSLLTGRRTSAPYGVEGGQAGATGINRQVKANGEEVELPWRCQVTVQSGQRLRIETPGGGGFGKRT